MPKMPKTSQYELSDEQKQQIVEQQVEQFKATRFAHQLDLARLAELPETEETVAAAANATEAIRVIEAAIDTTLQVSPDA